MSVSDIFCKKAVKLHELIFKSSNIHVRRIKSVQITVLFHKVWTVLLFTDLSGCHLELTALTLHDSCGLSLALDLNNILLQRSGLFCWGVGAVTLVFSHF